MKKFIIDDNFFDVLPDVNIAVLILKNVDEKKKLSSEDSKKLEDLLKESNEIARKYITSDIISENEVVKIWRETYQKFPTKKGARCSVENLLKRVLHGKPVGNIFPSVDITNSISLKYALPIGAEDRDKIDGDIHLGIMNGGEKFLPIGSDKEEPPLEGEIAYFDDYGVICRCLNWRDGIRTEINDNTTSEFIAMECVDPTRIEDLKNAIDELEKLMVKYMGAKTVNKQIINRNNSSMEIE